MAAKKTQPGLGAIILVLLLAAAGLLYWFFFLRPAIAEIGELREANAALEREIDALQSKVAQKPEIERNWLAISDRQDELFAAIPGLSNLPQALGALEELFESSGLSVESMSAGQFQDGEGYRFIPVTLRAGGAVKEILQLLEDLEQFEHLTMAKEASMEESGASSRLNVTFDLIFSPEGEVKMVGSEELPG